MTPYPMFLFIATLIPTLSSPVQGTTGAPYPPLCQSEDADACAEIPEGLCALKVVEWICPHKCKACGGGGGGDCSLMCGAGTLLDDVTCQCIPETADCSVKDRMFCLVLKNNPDYKKVCGNPLISRILCPASCGMCDGGGECSLTCAAGTILDKVTCQCIPDKADCSVKDRQFCLVLKNNPDYKKVCGNPLISRILCPASCGMCGHCGVLVGLQWCHRFPEVAKECWRCP